MARALIVSILGDAKQFGAELDKAAGKTRSLGKAAGVAGLAIAGGLAVGLEASVKEAMAGQAATARLDAAFKQSGESAKKYAAAITQAEAAGRKLGFTNLQTRDSLGSLEIATHNHTQAIKDLGVAEDVARFKHVDLASASKMLSMAMTGSQRAIKQLGLTLQPVTTAEEKVKSAFQKHSGAAYDAAMATAKLQDKQETIKDVIGLVTDKMHGQAKAFADTAAGGMAQMHAQIAAIGENLGTALLPALTAVTAKIADMAAWLSKHTTVAKIAVIALGALAAALMVLSVATSIAAAAATSFALPVLAVVAALAVLGVAIYEIVQHWGAISAFFSGVWDKIKGVFMAGIDFVKSHWRDFVMALAAIIAGPLGLLVSYIATHWGQIKADTIQAWNAILGFLRGIWNTLGNLAGNIWNGVKGAWSAAWNGLVGAVKGPINSIIGFVNAMIAPIESAIHLLEKLFSTHSGGPASSGGTKPGQPRGPVGGRGASGGIVTQATWALIGEGGPEALIPLSRMPGASPLGGGGGGAPTINVTVHGWVGSDQQLAQRLRNELVSLGRREPNIFAGYA